MTENHRWKILCVDDEALVLSSFRRFFLDDDCELFLASSAMEAWNILNCHAPAHLVLSDYRMPGENGLELLLRIATKWPDTIRFIVSGYVDTALVEQSIMRREVDYFIPKPWASVELRQVLEEAKLLYADRTKA